MFVSGSELKYVQADSFTCWLNKGSRNSLHLKKVFNKDFFQMCSFSILAIFKLFAQTLGGVLVFIGDNNNNNKLEYCKSLKKLSWSTCCSFSDAAVTPFIISTENTGSVSTLTPILIDRYFNTGTLNCNICKL